MLTIINYSYVLHIANIFRFGNPCGAGYSLNNVVHNVSTTLALEAEGCSLALCYTWQHTNREDTARVVPDEWEPR
jgi:hypothetical protein